MKKDTLLAASLLLLALLPPATGMFPAEPPYEAHGSDPDSYVVIAEAVKFDVLKVSDRISYELGYFQLHQQLKLSSAASAFACVDDKKKMFCVIRLSTSPDFHVIRQTLEPKKEYLLVLKHLTPDGLYSFPSNYQHIPEATKENVDKMKEWLDRAKAQEDKRGIERILKEWKASDEIEKSGIITPKEATATDTMRVKELHAYLRSPELLQRLRVSELSVIEQEGDTASIGMPGGTHTHGMVYYTTQKGWYLPREGEKLEHRENGWVILEGGKP